MQSISKSTLSHYSSLKLKKFRDQHNMYFISGFNAIETALKSKNIQIKTLLVRSDQTDKISKLNFKNEIPVYKLTEKQFDQLSDERSPQGILLIAHRPDTTFIATKLKSDIFVYLDQVNDPGNLGTIIRTAAWFGVNTILLSPDSADPYQPKTTRASVGIISHIQIYENVNSKDLKALKDKTFKLIGASVYGNHTLNECKFNPSQRYGLIFGSEAHGISDQILVLLDEQIKIPVSGIGESLNLAASTSIFLYQYRQHVK